MRYLGQIKATLLAIAIGIGLSVQGVPEKMTDKEIMACEYCAEALRNG